jgi:hypothetical protein
MSDLYYKHVTIVNDGSSIVSKGSSKLIDYPRVVIYDRHRFIIQATSYDSNSKTFNANVSTFSYSKIGYSRPIH